MLRSPGLATASDSDLATAHKLSQSAGGIDGRVIVIYNIDLFSCVEHESLHLLQSIALADGLYQLIITNL